jgi:hypothetical protein
VFDESGCEGGGDGGGGSDGANGGHDDDDADDAPDAADELLVALQRAEAGAALDVPQQTPLACKYNN